MKKIKCLCALFCAVILFVCSVPAQAATYPEASSTDINNWYLLGDVDRSGSVNSTDARTILQIAAYQIEAPADTSMTFGAADYDRDNNITARDARLALRLAAKLDGVSANQVAHPYKQYSTTAPSKKVSVDILSLANQLKARPETGITRNYTYTNTDVSYGDVAIKAGLSLSATAMKTMKDEISEKQTTTNKMTASYYTASGYRSSAYYSYLPVCGDPNFVFPEALADNTALIKSVSKVTLNADNTFSIRIAFNDFTVTKNAENDQVKLMENILPEIHDSTQLISMGDQLANSLGGSDTEGISVELHNSISFATTLLGQEKTYNYQNAVTGAYVEFKFNPYGYPLSATYYSKQAITIPATLTLGIDKATFAMTSYEEVTCTYTFSNTKIS